MKTRLESYLAQTITKPADEALTVELGDNVEVVSISGQPVGPDIMWQFIVKETENAE